MSIQLGRGGRPLRIGYGRIFHEANAYSPLLTTREAFTGFHHLEGAALGRVTALRGKELEGYLAHAELTGFVQAARVAGGVETVPLTSSLAVPSGPLTLETFEWLVDGLARSVAAAGPMDGIYLALHGSMEVAGLMEAPEAVIIRRVREAAGRPLKVAVSLDLHANLSAGIVDGSDVLVAYRTNPHWDLAPTGFRAGNRLIRTLRAEVNPVHAWRKLPMVLGGGMTIDFLAPMRSVFSRMRALEDDERVLSASLFMVHPYTSAENLGWAVHVTTNGDAALADQLADQLADWAWAVRREPMPPMRTVDEGLEEAQHNVWRKLGPVTLVDVDDIVGAGAPGGNTHVIQALMRNDHGLRVYVPLHDPAAVQATWECAVGTAVNVQLRGTPGYGQPEVTLQATIGAKETTPSGRVVRLDCGPWHAAITEFPPLPIHPSFWSKLGLNARKADVIVQKNFFHYRMFYAATSFSHIPVVSAGATSFERIRSRDFPLPVFPKHDLADWRGTERELRAMPPRSRVKPVARDGVSAAAV